MYFTGQKVVCVNSDGLKYLKKGKIYIVVGTNYYKKTITVRCDKGHFVDYDMSRFNKVYFSGIYGVN